MKRAARKQVKKFGKGGLNRYASMMADKLKSPTMSPTERDRIQRAVDQGFTNIVYHSTDTPWDEIDLNYTDVGLHAGTPTQAANRALDKAIEAKLQERREQGQYIDTTNVLPLAYRPGKTLKMPDVGEFKDAYTTLLDMRTAPELRGQGWMQEMFEDIDLQKNAYPGSQSKDWLDSMENRMALAEIRRNLLDRGYRQIVYPNTHENAYGELTNLMPEYQDQLDQLSRDADALYQKSLSMRPQAPQPGATEQEIEAFLHPRDPLSYLDPEEAALYNKYRNEMQRIEMSPGAYETGESIIFLDPADVRSVYAEFAPEAAQQTGLGKKQGGPAKFGKGGLSRAATDLADKARATDTPEFKNWFGESQVRDAEGRPLRLYHGTPYPEFDQFSKDMIGENFGQDKQGFFFTTDPDRASDYAQYDEIGMPTSGGQVIPVYLSMKNPLVVKVAGDQDTLIRAYDKAKLQLLEQAAQTGHDGIEVMSTTGHGSMYVALEPTQIKSAIGNEGAFDPANPAITKKQGGPVYDPSRINQMVDDLLDPMYEFEPYDDEAYEVQRFAKGGLPTPQRQWLENVVEQEIANYLPFYSRRDRDELVEAMEKPEYAQLSAAERAPRERKLAAYRGRQALMDWMSGTATKYLKRDFGTEFDPMRDLSIRHVQSDVWPPREIGPYSQPARAVPEYWKEYNSWVEGLDPETPVYMGLRPGTLEEPGLNIRHLRDELLNAMSAETGLPRNLQIRPESLQRMSFPQASELVGKISQYRAEQAARRAAELDEKLKPDVFKQYPEGYRWVRLNKPGQFEAESELMGHSVRGYEPDAGPGYGLGGWPAIERGEAQVYSLRDPQGLPHVTVEAANFEPKGLAASEMGLPAAMFITQIKGKQNQAPVGAYLPYVQDFVRSGNWNDVRELENARLRDMNRYSPMQEWMKSQGIEKPRYLTEDEYQALEADFLLQQLGQKPDGMKEGGIVEDDFLKANPGGRVPLTLDDLVARYAPDPINALIAAFDTQTTPNEDGMSGLALSVAGLPQTFRSLGSLGAGALRSGIEYLSPMAAERMREVSERGAAAREMLIPETVRNAASTMMAGSANASQAYDDLLNQMLEKRGLGPAETLSVPSQFALAGGEMFGQAPLPQAKMLKSTAKTIGDMIALPFDYFGPTVDPKLSNYALGTLLGGASRAAFSDLGEQAAERQAQIDYDDLMQMLRRNAAIDLPSTRELTAKLPARPVDRRFSYEPPRFGFADGGAVEMSKGGLGRLTLQQKAKALGFPSTGSTEQLERLVRAAEADPQTWTQEDFDLIAPHLAIHQDIRPGSAERVESILSEGLRSGMVDPVSNMLSGDFTWARGLRDTDAYLMPYGSLKYQSKDNPRLAPGNMPMLHFRPEPGESMYDAIRRSGKRPVVTKAEGGPVYDPARIESMVNELMEPQKLAKGGLPTPPKGPGKDVPRGRMPDAEASRIAGAVEEGQRLPVREGPLPAGMARESVVMPGEVGYDIRFDPRVNEQEKLQSSVFRYQEPQAVEIPEISIFDLEGRPFILGMADRTAAGKYLTGINDIDFDIPVGLEGGQGFMFYNPGRGWAADKGPVSAFLNAARRMDEDPLFLPFRMAPTGGDYAHMTAETMLAAARNNMSKKNIKAANSLIRQVIPDFKGIEDIQSIRQLSSASGNQRKAFLGIMDKEFRDKGGLNIGQARLAVSEPEQYQAMDLGLQNVGTIFRGQPRVAPSGHGTYAAAMPGGGLGVLKEKGISAFELLPELVEKRDINIARPGSTEAYTIRRGIRSGVITEDILRQIQKRLAERMGFAQGGLAVAALMPDEQSAEIDAAVDSILAESAATGVSPEDVLLQSVAPIEARAHGGLATYKDMIGA